MKWMCGLLPCIVVLAVVVGVASAPVGARPGTARSVDAVVSGTFVGRGDGASVGVAVVAEKPAAQGQARTVSVYVCNGTSLSVWLTGTTAGNTAELTSADGRIGVHVILSAQQATGKVGLLGGSGFRFTVPRASGLAGLFDVSVLANGLLRGTSATGGSLTGRVGAGGRLPARGTALATARAGGRTVKLKAPARDLTAGAYRWIVLSDGTVWGASKLGPIRGGIGGLRLVRPSAGRQLRIKAGSAGQKGYDDKKCGQLADAFNRSVAQLEAAVMAGKDTSKIGDKGTKVFDELSDHCFILF